MHYNLDNCPDVKVSIKKRQYSAKDRFEMQDSKIDPEVLDKRAFDRERKKGLYFGVEFRHLDSQKATIEKVEKINEIIFFLFVYSKSNASFKSLGLNMIRECAAFL